MSERYITSVEYKDGFVQVHLDNGDTLGLLTRVEASQECSTRATVKLEAHMVKSDEL